MANTILERIQEKYPYKAADARNIAEALAMIYGTGGRGAGSIADVEYPKVSLHFKPNGGSGDGFDIEYIREQDAVYPECPFTPPEDKAFDYWCFIPSGAQTDSQKIYPGYDPTKKITTELNIYAIWKDAE